MHAVTLADIMTQQCFMHHRSRKLLGGKCPSAFIISRVPHSLLLVLDGF